MERKIKSVHKLHQVRSFAGNHNKHRITLGGGINGKEPYLSIKTYGSPHSKTFSEYEASLNDSELIYLNKFLKVTLKKDINQLYPATYKVTRKELNKFIDFVESHIYKELNQKQNEEVKLQKFLSRVYKIVGLIVIGSVFGAYELIKGF